MKIACLPFNPIQENTYVVWDDTKECVVIDAGNCSPREDAALDDFIGRQGLKPVLAANTHGHFDHTLGVGHLKQRYGIPFALSEKDRFLLDNAAVSGSLFGVKTGPMPAIDRDLDAETEIRFGNSVLRILRTPGHTPGHVAFYEPESKALFTGDTLFRGSIGTTMFGGSDAEMHETLEALYRYPGDYGIYPGHGESTSLSDEKRDNPFFEPFRGV